MLTRALYVVDPRRSHGCGVELCHACLQPRQPVADGGHIDLEVAHVAGQLHQPRLCCGNRANKIVRHRASEGGTVLTSAAATHALVNNTWDWVRCPCSRGVLP